MANEPTIAVLDIGKTNKKFFLFDRDYKVVFQRTLSFAQRLDEDGYDCEDLAEIEKFLFSTLEELCQSEEFDVKAINFSTYGASLVHVDAEGKPVVDMFNYLKPYPDGLLELLLPDAASKKQFELETCCPIQGNLNSGLQLFRIYHRRSELYSRIVTSLHFPQYVSFLLSREMYSDITSIGCHTSLWDFRKNTYHDWLGRLGIDIKLAPLRSCDTAKLIEFAGKVISVGTGMHDSSAALVPYLKLTKEPFLLMSTGTWSITLNPFNEQLLSETELEQGCLCYINYQGKPVKASRVFLGHRYAEEVARIADFFQTNKEKYNSLSFEKERLDKVVPLPSGHNMGDDILLDHFPFSQEDLGRFADDIDAYYQLVYELVHAQHYFVNIVDPNQAIKQVFVDGGFGQNDVFMHAMAIYNPNRKVFAAEVPQSTAVGAALVMHDHWNGNDLDDTDIVRLHQYQK